MTDPCETRLRRLRLRDLHALAAVAERGSMSKAAADASISQPAISQAINDLEATLGVRLLDRGPAGAVPTLYGKLLIQRGLEAFDALRQAMRDIAFLSQQPAGEIVIGTSESHIAGGLLAEIIRGIATEHPHVSLRIVEANTAAMAFAELREHRVDLMLGRIATAGLAEDLHADILFQEKLHIVVGGQNAWAHETRITLADLADKPWVLAPPKTAVHNLVAAAFAREGLQPPNVNVTTYSMNLRMQLLAGGDYVTAFPETLVRYNAPRWNLKILPIDLGETLPVALITLRDQTTGPAVRMFIQRARQAAVSRRQ